MSKHLTVIAFTSAILSVLLAAARAQVPAPPAQASRDASTVNVPSDYVIGAEDVIGVQFWREPDMSGDLTVRPDGKITLPLIGEITAMGMKPDVLRGEIQKAASRYLSDANVTVVVRQVNSRKVFITGQVGHPGAFPLATPYSVLQLIALAGGLNEYADGDHITIVRPVEASQPRVFKFNYKAVSKGRSLEQNIPLQPGDTVIVP